MTVRYEVRPYNGSDTPDRFGVWDTRALEWNGAAIGDWTRDAAGYVFQYSEAQAFEVAKSLNAPRYVCQCGYQVREDDREFHNSMICSATVPEDLCPSCGAIHTVGDCDDIPPNAGSAC